jgi:DNA-directed RNA polymerase subunit RPC12/RpoP
MRDPEGLNVRYVSLLTTDFDACDGYTGYVCPFCGHTERTSGCECASCGVRR